MPLLSPTLALLSILVLNPLGGANGANIAKGLHTILAPVALFLSLSHHREGLPSINHHPFCQECVPAIQCERHLTGRLRFPALSSPLPEFASRLAL